MVSRTSISLQIPRPPEKHSPHLGPESKGLFLLHPVRKQAVQEQSYKILKETYHLSARLGVYIVSEILQSKLQYLPSNLTGTESRFAFNPSTSCDYYWQP